MEFSRLEVRLEFQNLGIFFRSRGSRLRFLFAGDSRKRLYRLRYTGNRSGNNSCLRSRFLLFIGQTF